MEEPTSSPKESASPAPVPTPPKRRWLLPVALLVLIVAVIGGVQWYRHNLIHVSTDDAQVTADIYPVSPRVSGHVLAVRVDANQPVKAGEVLVAIDPRDYEVAVQQAEAALAQAQSAARAAGGSVEVTQRTGGAGISQAGAGVAVAEAQRQVAIRTAQAAQGQVAAARAAESAAASAVEMSQRDAASAEAAVAAARATAEEAQKEATRNRNLAAQGAVSGQQADQSAAVAATAQANLEMAKAKLRSAQAAVTQAEARRKQAAATVAQAGQSASASQAQIATTEATVRQAQAGLASSQVSPAQVGVRRSEAKGATANVAAARARLEQARLNLSYTRIVAPVDGTVAQKNVEVGQYVQPGQSLVAVVPMQGTYVLANYKETQLERVRVGQPARFTVDAYPGAAFTGSVESISPGTGSVFSLLPPENASGNFTKVVQRVPVRIRITSAANPQAPLRAGMSAVATVEVGAN